MIVTLRSRKAVEACRWSGDNRLELEEFTGHGVEFTIYSNKPPVPEIGGELIGIGDYVVRTEDGCRLLKRADAERDYVIER